MMKCPKCGNAKTTIEIDLNICCYECWLNHKKMVIMIDEERGICYCSGCNDYGYSMLFK